MTRRQFPTAAPRNCTGARVGFSAQGPATAITPPLSLGALLASRIAQGSGVIRTAPRPPVVSNGRRRKARRGRGRIRVRQSAAAYAFRLRGSAAGRLGVRIGSCRCAASVLCARSVQLQPDQPLAQDRIPCTAIAAPSIASTTATMRLNDCSGIPASTRLPSTVPAITPSAASTIKAPSCTISSLRYQR